MFTVVDLRCEYRRNPIGIDVASPRISWKLKSDVRGESQTAYELEVSSDLASSQVLWTSGYVNTAQSVHVALEGLQLRSRIRYYYRVRCWNREGAVSAWSDTAFFETGVLDQQEWRAKWISANSSVIPSDSEQVPMLRKTFSLAGEVREARLYATALGIYELELNGARVGDSYFTPGWTSYRHRLQVQTYDVADLLKAGGNALGAMIGKGWYRGNLAWKNQHDIYGDKNALFAELHVIYADGSEETIVSDESWVCAGSPILMSELYHGETYDARLELPDWSLPGYDDSSWGSVELVDQSNSVLRMQENDPVRKMQEIAPIALIRTPAGETVLDFGQNMVGWVRFTVRGEAGSTVEVHHAEVLDRDGNFYTENMRAAKVTLTYTLKGSGEETYEPRFTFQGFRYIRLIGFGEEVALADFTGIVLHTDMERIGSFECSEPLVNQLQHNIEWGLKGNFLDVPTDCPQRDERLGWTGDAQVFIRTASYLHQIAPFFTKWLRDLAADQRADGGVPFVIPHVLDENAYSSSAWGDAAVICPWTVYLAYGDTRILEEQYDSMKAWVEYIRAQGDNEYLWNTGFHFGDWLGLDAKADSYIGATERDYIATAFYAYSTSLLVKTATVIGRAADAAAYAELYAKIVAAFNKEFVTPSGRLSAPTQTAHVLGLMFGLLEGTAKERAIAKLKVLLEESNNHLTTGFVGTPYLNFVLTDNGMNDAAYKLLLQQDYPSWLYQVTKGATTIWEHWDGIKEDGSFWSKDMNSFNHYAYGAIGDWMYRRVAGIDLAEGTAGYKEMFIRPYPGEGLEWVSAKMETMYGEVSSSWRKREGAGLELAISVPVNASATVVLPGAQLDVAQESGAALSAAAGISGAVQTADGVQLKIGSGDYRFVW